MFICYSLLDNSRGCSRHSTADVVNLAVGHLETIREEYGQVAEERLFWHAIVLKGIDENLGTHLVYYADALLVESLRLISSSAQGLCVVVSCVGRRIVLGQLTEEELEAVERHAGAGMKLTGFYSYGELAPVGDVLQCHLHNQTMSLTTIQE